MNQRKKLMTSCCLLPVFYAVQAMAAYKQPLHVANHRGCLNICKQSHQQHREYQCDSSYPRSNSSCSG